LPLFAEDVRTLRWVAVAAGLVLAAVGDAGHGFDSEVLIAVAVFPVRVVVGLSTSTPSSVFPFARLRLIRFLPWSGSIRIPSPSFSISALLEMTLRSDGSPRSRYKPPKPSELPMKAFCSMRLLSPSTRYADELVVMVSLA
jgi:hypothetical protein